MQLYRPISRLESRNENTPNVTYGELSNGTLVSEVIGSDNWSTARAVQKTIEVELFSVLHRTSGF